MLKDRVLPLLRENGMTQADLAERLGFSVKHVSEILHEKTGQSIENLNKLAKALDTNVGYLIGESVYSGVPFKSAPETKTTSELNFAYWGQVVDNAKKVAAKMNNGEKEAVTSLLKEALRILEGDIK